MKKTLSAVLLSVLIFNSIFYNAEASNKKIFGETEVKESLMEILSEDPDLLLQQYSNILSVETMELPNAYCSKGEIVKAYEQDQDGTVSLLETKTTLTKIQYKEELGLSLKSDEMPTTLYVLTADTYSSDSTTQYGVSMSGTIVWKDYFGMSNELVSIAGVRSGSYTGDGSYYCRSGTHQVAGWTTFTGASFFDNSVSGEEGFGFELVIFSPSTSSTKKAKLTVSTSILD